MAGISANALVEATEIAARQANASARLRCALISGGDTAHIRSELADLDRQATELAAAQARRADTQEAEMAAQIEADAADIVVDAHSRVDTLMATLEIPPMPTKRARSLP